jgi:uncharacterized membrane protein YcaP (DUF421 family)
VSYVNFRVRHLRPLLEGEPLVLVDDGRVIERHLVRERTRIDDLTPQARLQSLTSPHDVRRAVLETSSQISFIPKKS